MDKVWKLGLQIVGKKVIKRSERKQNFHLLQYQESRGFQRGGISSQSPFIQGHRSHKILKKTSSAYVHDSTLQVCRVKQPMIQLEAVFISEQVFDAMLEDRWKVITHTNDGFEPPPGNVKIMTHPGVSTLTQVLFLL